MKVSNFIPCLTAIYDREILGKVYQPNVKSRNDFALWLKILNGGTVPKAYCLPITTAKYRRNSYGISSNTLDSWRFFRYCLMEYGRCSSVGAHVYSIIYIFVTLIKKKFPRIYNIFVVKIWMMTLLVCWSNYSLSDDRNFPRRSALFMASFA